LPFCSVRASTAWNASSLQSDVTWTKCGGRSLDLAMKPLATLLRHRLQVSFRQPVPGEIINRRRCRQVHLPYGRRRPWSAI
jgi:hypothetical protein